MSLAIMAQQCTIPSFWGEMAACRPSSRYARSTMDERTDMVAGIIKASDKPLTTDQIYDKAFAAQREITRNIVAHALRTMLRQGRVNKEVQKIKPGVRLAYWRLV